MEEKIAIKVEEVSIEKTELKNLTTIVKNNLPNLKVEELKQKPNLTGQNPERRRSSALSLNSLTQKREHTKKEKVVVNIEELPKNPFSTKQLLDYWQDYIYELNKKGEKLLASMMRSNIPEVKQNILQFTLPNSRMESSLLKSKPKILKYLRDKLQNYEIDFETKINKEVEKKFAYTPKEKYAVLLEKNKLLSKLKNTFDLDV